MTAATGRLTLAVTSSTGVMGLAVGRVSDGHVGHLGEVVVVTDRRHAEEISPRLQMLLADAGVALRDIDLLAIDVGPGRFTGLRVGLATVRALAFSLDRPVIGLSSLTVLAAGTASEVSNGAGDTVTAVIDARRNEVFQQTFTGGSASGPAVVGGAETLAAQARGVVVGDGLDRYLDHYRAAAARTGAIPVTEQNPRAATMLELCRGVDGEPGTSIQPLYLRDPDANPNIKTRPQPTGAA